MGAQQEQRGSVGRDLEVGIYARQQIWTGGHTAARKVQCSAQRDENNKQQSEREKLMSQAFYQRLKQGSWKDSYKPTESNKTPGPLPPHLLKAVEDVSQDRSEEPRSITEQIQSNQDPLQRQPAVQNGGNGKEPFPAQQSKIAPAENGKGSDTQALQSLNVSSSQVAQQGSKTLKHTRVTRVKFWLQYHAQFGQRIRLVGSLDPTGNWMLSKGVELQWSPGDKWNAIVELPSGAILEYKYVLLQGDGVNALAWQNGNNSVLAVGHADDDVQVFDNWECAPGASVLAAGETTTRESRLLVWANEIESLFASQRSELRRSRMELVSAQEEARAAREETRQVRAELSMAEAARSKAEMKVKELTTSSSLLRTQLAETNRSFQKALETTHQLLEEAQRDRRESGGKASSSGSHTTSSPPSSDQKQEGKVLSSGLDASKITETSDEHQLQPTSPVQGAQESTVEPDSLEGSLDAASSGPSKTEDMVTIAGDAALEKLRDCLRSEHAGGKQVWELPAEAQLLVPDAGDKLFVREAYTQLVKQLRSRISRKKKQSRELTLIGSKGMGKSMWLLYALGSLLADDSSVVLFETQAVPDSVFLFTRESCFRAKTIEELSALKQHRDNKALVHLIHGMASKHTFGTSVLVDPPEAISSQALRDAVVMEPWSRAELRKARSIFPDVSEKQMLRSFARWGGRADVAFNTHDAGSDSYLESLVRSCRIEHIQEAVLHNSWNQDCSQLLHAIAKPGTLQFSHLETASRHVSDQLLAALLENEPEKIKEFLRSHAESSSGSNAALPVVRSLLGSLLVKKYAQGGTLETKLMFSGEFQELSIGPAPCIDFNSLAEVTTEPENALWRPPARKFGGLAFVRQPDDVVHVFYGNGKCDTDVKVLSESLKVLRAAKEKQPVNLTCVVPEKLFETRKQIHFNGKIAKPSGAAIRQRFVKLPLACIRASPSLCRRIHS